jgi:hypothetical protein
MVMPNEVPVLPVLTDAPLRAQRRRLLDRVPAVLGRRQHGQGSGLVPAEAMIESKTQPARRPWDTPVRFMRQMTGRRRVPPAGVPDANEALQQTAGSAETEAALVQRITGPGSGPYSGTPFLVVPRSADDAAQPRAADEPCEAARHDHGIIDHSRHVSSIGRR